MKVLIVVEKVGTAIDRLAHMTVKAAPWHEYRIVDVHPKRPNEQQLTAFQEAMEWCDVIDFRYWKTAETLRGYHDIKKPCMLTHYNPYDLNRQQWSEYRANVVVNKEQQMTLKHASTLVPLPIDLDYWEYKDPNGAGPTPEYDIIMVANRIEGKKGILPVAKLCGEFGYTMALVGSISDPTYFDEVMRAGKGMITQHLKVTDDDLKALYILSRIHISNSVDNFESGTMPMLEAMACGTPVLTRRTGHVPDIFNGRNMAVRKSTQDDSTELHAMIKEMLDDPKYRKELAHEGRASLRSRTLEIYGSQMSKLYHQIRGTEELVSVIVPTTAEPEELAKTLAHILAMDEPDMEIIVLDDTEDPRMNQELVQALRNVTSHTVKFYSVATFTFERSTQPHLTKTYGLARARNKGILEAEGTWIMFVDDRIHVDRQAINAFRKRAKPGTWLWGVKDQTPKGFVENLSFIKREDIIRIGGFSEQITQYGGMTQEVRKRAEQNKIAFEMVEDATGVGAYKSRSRWNKYTAIAKSKSQCYKLYG